MDCVNTNFEECYESIKKHLPACSFVAMDLELTGIKTSDAESYIDTPAERYNKLKSAASKYRIIQIGISLFTDIGNNQFEARTYNAYVFPRENYNFSPQIVMDASAIEFNMKHKMNFQKWIYEGVPYIQYHTAKKKRDEINTEEEKKEESNDIVLTQEDDITKRDAFLKKLAEFLASGSAEPLCIEEQSAFMRRYMYEYLQKNHPKLVAFSEFKAEGSKEKVMKIYNFTEEQRKEYEEKQRKVKLDKLDAQIGFTRVLELLIQERKPLVGHNCYFDLLFIMHSFIENLPNRFVDFKKRLNNFFPTIYDTKHIAHRPPFASIFQDNPSSLEAILEKIKEHKDKSLFSNHELVYPEGFKKYDLFNPSDDAYHEAGFDSLLTGYVYLKMFHQLEPEHKGTVVNTVNVLRSHFLLSLDKEDDVLTRPNPIFVFCKQETDDTKFAQSDLLDHFKELSFEFEDLRVNTFYQNRRAIAFVKLETANEEKMSAFMKKCQLLKETGVMIETITDFAKRRTQESEAAAAEGKTYENKRGGRRG
eukprot:CAMPEP_0176462384 /NCGR_PEP_ID=MMETSP0127-20121128/35233_1 /TAXON_ID=938130 /ORGANISM="Platyophrya macrostoma, Strain WH" /LENGTH=532 /DNA_ID=CAMNT_0017854287 /DNA_START=24 /DNA_END=1622 /DNA_ORIENTATION=+